MAVPREKEIALNHASHMLRNFVILAACVGAALCFIWILLKGAKVTYNRSKTPGQNGAMKSNFN
jgi:hypothetical protein